MQRGHKITHPTALDLPERFDPSGIPCVGSGQARGGAPSAHRKHSRSLPGLPPTSVIASVEHVAEASEREWLIWGCVDSRPVLFAVEAGAAAEMLHAVTVGETATAIVEPWQLLLERLD